MASRLPVVSKMRTGPEYGLATIDLMISRRLDGSAWWVSSLAAGDVGQVFRGCRR